MAGTEHTDDDRSPDRSSAAEDPDRHSPDPDRQPAERDRRPFDGIAEWIAASALRAGLALVGFIVLLFGLGMAMGVDLLGMVASVVNSEVGRWLLVALVGFVIIAVAVRGFGTRE